MKRKRELEMAKMALQLDEDELQMQTDIAVADAKAMIYDKFEKGEIDHVETPKVKLENVELKSKPLQSTVQPAIETAILDPMAKIFQPVKKKSDILKETSNLDFVNLPSVNMIKNTSKLPKQNVHESYGPTHIDNTTSVPIQSLTINPSIAAETAFQSMVQHLRKPTPEIRKFSGNPLEYRKFLRQFESKVVLNCEQDDEKMNYLEQLTFGEAHKVVSSYSHLPGDRAYKASMRHLEERYGDTDVMASAFIKKALDWPNIKSGDIQSLDEFALFLVECQYGTESMEAGSVLEYSENIKRLMSKLPFHMHDRWRNVVFRVKDSHRTVKFNDFVNFVKAEAKKATDPTYGNIAMNYSNSRSTNQQRQHGQKVSNKRHMSNKCNRRLKCSICARLHPTILHIDNQINKQSSSQQEPSVKKDDPQIPTNHEGTQPVVVSSISSDKGAGDVNCAMAIIPVRVKLNNRSQSVETYAFFDSGSSITFCSQKLMQQLGANGKKTQITISTMGNTQTINTCAINGLQVSSLSMEHMVDLPKVYTKENLPVSKEHIPTQREIKKWTHLESVDIPEIDADIGIMIGNNVPDAYTPFNVCTGPSGSPHATKTRLGWILWNVIRDSSSFEVNRVHMQNEGCDETQLNLLMQSINLDFPERMNEDKRENSIDDKTFMQQVESSIHLENQHYCIALPFRDQHVVFPNNSVQGIKRLNGLRHKFAKNDNFKQQYCDFMSKIIEKGYAEPVPTEDVDRNDGKVWYLPHHGVYHAKKQDKIRVVFDCSVKYMGISLNSQLLQGPNLANNLLGVLIRFRQDKIAVLGDIESMFYQVKVPVEDRDFLRFYWWENGNVDTEPKEYRMTVHLFGATSSPSCSNYALQNTAKENKDRFDSLVIDTLTKNMYVDDCLSSTDTEESAISLIKNVTELCKEGGFNMTKWTSNSQNVVQSIPEKDCARNIEEWNCGDDSLTDRALGVYWYIKDDKLGFHINIKEKPSTRRGILSIVSSIYDPIGIVSPFVLTAKSILQGLCKKEIGWDEEIPNTELSSWNKWLSQLKGLENIKIDRCYKPQHFKAIVSCQLHCFADASDKGYGCVFYIRLVDEEGSIQCSFLLGKSRVAPLKSMTIPRMELTAATSAVRLGNMIIREIEYSFDDIYYYTDSMSVLRYIANSKTRFHTFVANRLAVIHEATKVNQWHYVGTKENPADLASRGATIEQFNRNPQWLRGPDFLWDKDIKFPQCTEDTSFIGNDPEVKKPVAVCTVESFEGMERLISYFSNWERLVTITARFVLAANHFRNARDSIEIEGNGKMSMKMSDTLTTSIVECAERSLISYVQHKHLSEDIQTLEKKCPLKISSKLSKLDPFVDKDGLLRVGGRLERSDISYESKHPIILPKDSPISRLIIENIHRSIGHLGKNSILAVLRQKYWILGANSIIKGLVSRCVRCKKYQGTCAKQKMANLPKERLQADDPPFTRIGIDFFGPFEVKQGRSVVKRYGVIFTCLTIRAIHLELAYSLDTDSCINAIRRFISRRGVPVFIRTDNGTNFVGSERELGEEIKRWNFNQIQEFMIQKRIQWEFNPPSASHFGGVWERLIRSVRKVFYSVMHEQNIRLTDEGLMTLFCEVESILNGRPITEASDSITDLNVLTPNHLILQRPGESFPPGVFSKTDSYVRRRWRQIQYLADLFWTRWRKEYLPLLQRRTKWTKPTRNMQVGDIVLISDNAPRNSWNMARVIELIKDKDNVVRIVKVKTANSVLMRPIAKLCLLVEVD
ncbi:unnamed protein product [Mytilus edulis]|uniref:Integrase catalytic domain-containing protein n=1 Tax=Mytilus edulis TaxID=6550 RepID=A0A8S3V8N7_MYTED|nr:unnamed protein product [Mytilus edulis]